MIIKTIVLYDASNRSHEVVSLEDAEKLEQQIAILNTKLEELKALHSAMAGWL